MKYNEITCDSAKDAVSFLRGVFPPKKKYKDLIENGASGHEEHTLRGDDLASACHSLEIIYYWILHEKNLPDE